MSDSSSSVQSSVKEDLCCCYPLLHFLTSCKKESGEEDNGDNSTTPRRPASPPFVPKKKMGSGTRDISTQSVSHSLPSSSKKMGSGTRDISTQSVSHSLPSSSKYLPTKEQYKMAIDRIFLPTTHKEVVPTWLLIEHRQATLKILHYCSKYPEYRRSPERVPTKKGGTNLAESLITPALVHKNNSSKDKQAVYKESRPTHLTIGGTKNERSIKKEQLTKLSIPNTNEASQSEALKDIPSLAELKKESETEEQIEMVEKGKKDQPMKKEEEIFPLPGTSSQCRMTYTYIPKTFRKTDGEKRFYETKL